MIRKITPNTIRMSVVDDLKSTLNDISGKRRITILQQFVSKAYSKPDTPLRNVIGEYSPRQIMDNLRQIISYIKGLSAKQGVNLKKYYSYAQIAEIHKLLEDLSILIVPIRQSSGQKPLRTILYALPSHLEKLKNVIGPYVDLKPIDSVDDLRAQLLDFETKSDTFAESRKQMLKDAKEIQSNLKRTRDLKNSAAEIINEIDLMKKEFKVNDTLAKEIIKRINTISNSTSEAQKKLSDSLSKLSNTEETINKTTKNLEEKYAENALITDSIRSASDEIENTKQEVQYLLAQARHALHLNHGASISGTYRKLHDASRQSLLNFFLLFLSITSFAAATALAVTAYFQVRLLQSFSELLQQQLVLVQIILIPIFLIVFFGCMRAYRIYRKRTHLYANRIAALESFLHVSDRLPHNTPEKIHTANYIFNTIKKDFGIQNESKGFAFR